MGIIIIDMTGDNELEQTDLDTDVPKTETNHREKPSRVGDLELGLQIVS